MSWMHDRAPVSRSRRRTAPGGALSQMSPAGPVAAFGPATSVRDGGGEGDAEHVGIPRILGRRARWMTSRLSRRA